MDVNDSVREYLYEVLDEEAVIYDGFDEAVLGVSERFGEDAVIIYDKEKVIDILMKDGMTDEEAIEHFYYNVLGTYAGKYTPIFLDRMY